MLDIACLNQTMSKLVISWGANVDINNAHTQSEKVKWSVSKSVGCWSTIPYFRYLQGFSQPVDFEIYSWSKFRRLSFKSSARLKMKRWLYNNETFRRCDLIINLQFWNLEVFVTWTVPHFYKKVALDHSNDPTWSYIQSVKMYWRKKTVLPDFLPRLIEFKPG